MSLAVPTDADAPDLGRTIRAGALSIVVLVGGLGAWSATAPLDSAATAPGRVMVESGRKTVQHLEGGIVGAILVTEGARVAAGDPLVLLDDTQARAALDGHRVQRDELAAREARLLAERAGAAGIDFPSHLAARAGEARVADLLDGQRRLFAARAESFRGQVDILNRRLAQLDAETDGLKAQLKGADRQFALIQEERTGVQALVDRGLERRTRLLALEREAAQLEGRRGELRAAIARTEQRRGETELEILDQRNRRAEEVAGELREVQAELAKLDERLRSAEDVLARTVVRAPIDGLAMNLKIHTAGGVIRAGEPILDLVPTDERLIVEAHVRPTDIDAVRGGLPARVRLTAFNHRTTPVLAGRVTHVAADALSDPKVSDPKGAGTYYAARIAVEREELERAGGLSLVPGMPADVMILTGRRTALDYLLAPLTDSFARAFREE